MRRRRDGNDYLVTKRTDETDDPATKRSAGKDVSETTIKGLEEK